jgi:hypothetical protein
MRKIFNANFSMIMGPVKQTGVGGGLLVGVGVQKLMGKNLKVVSL